MVLTGIAYGYGGCLRYKGTPPHFSCVSGEHQFDIRASDVIVLVLCVSPDGVVLCLVFVLYSLMVEKVESLLRGQWSAFNIYRAVSSPPSRFCVSWRRLARASRSCFSFSRLVVGFSS